MTRYKQTKNVESKVKTSKKSLCYRGYGQRRKVMDQKLKERINNAIMLLEDADNVYRTKFYIIKQKIVVVDGKPGTSMILSEDTFYSRNPFRDEEYELLFEARGKKINGKRIVAGLTTRKYAG